MSCPGDDTIARYVDGDLAESAAAAIRAHMDGCDACRSLVADVAQDVVPPTRMIDPLETGTVLVGKYRIVQILGHGGMGVVVAALHEELKQKVAIKVMHGESLEDRDSIKRFLREGRAAAKLRSDHAVRIYDVGRLPGGVPFLVMEHLDGEDLAALQRRRPLEIDEAVDYVLQAIDAIAEAHSYGLVHRDIKPANLFLAHLPNGDTRVKVLDFGLAKELKGLASDADSHLTAEHMFIGSPMFMSPEQIRDARSVDKRTDIWSLGATLWQLVTNTAPFSSGSVQTTLAEVCTKTLPPASRVRPGIPPSIDAAIARCMHKDREQRFATVEELAIALGGPLRSRSSRREETAPATPKIPATELMPGVDLMSPTVVEHRPPVFRVTAPLAAPLPPHPPLVPTVARATPKKPGTSARAIVLLALVPVVGLTAFLAHRLRESSAHPSPTASTSSSSIIVVVPVSAAPVSAALSASSSATPAASSSAVPSATSAPSMATAAPTTPTAKAKPPVVPKTKATASAKPVEKDPYDR